MATKRFCDLCDKQVEILSDYSLISLDINNIPSSYYTPKGSIQMIMTNLEICHECLLPILKLFKIEVNYQG